MEKWKFWGIAVLFILFLWFLSPDNTSDEKDFLSTNTQLNNNGVIIDDKSLAHNTPEPHKFDASKVTITTKNGNLPLVLGFAHTKQQQSSGLMHYRVWPNNMHGLLFLFQKEDEYTMWMHNTHLSLDMLFIDRDGYITQIERNTEPLSAKPIKSRYPVLAILEIPAGSANKWNIQKGDQIRLKYFRSALPAQ